MDLPGPGGVVWSIALLAMALGVALLGDVLRRLAARWVSFFAAREPIERGLLDLYLGGAVLYVLAAVPFGGFVPLLPAVVLGVGALAFGIDRARRPRATLTGARELLRPFTTWPYLATLGATVLLYGIEVALVIPVATGNTFDSSLYTTYTALLFLHGTITTSFLPLAGQGLAYPQGATVWFAAAQSLFALPPARTSLLVTPLFLALSVPGAFLVGRQWLGSDRAGAAFALCVALLGSWSRVLVAGSNDFALAFPLVLLLLARTPAWVRPGPPPWGDAVAFGALAGYAAALNPVGSQWWFLALPVAALLFRPVFGGAARRWWSRWFAALAAALPFVAPSLAVLAKGRGSPGLVPGSAALPTGTVTHLTLGGLIGSIDPFLFGPGDYAFSPFPVLRAELAILLVAGALGILVAGTPFGRTGLRAGPFGRFALAGTVVALGLMGLETVADPGTPLLGALPFVTSVGELSILVFSLFTFVAAYPIAFLLERGTGALAEAGPADGSATRPRDRRRPRPRRALPPTIAVFLALALLVPGAATTATSFPAYTASLYADFSNVSAADFALLDWCGTHLPAGSRVLVAPGSAAEFVPGYAPRLVLFYPMMANYAFANASYALAVGELTHGRLDAAGQAALADLAVGWILVTQNNSVLYPPFAPAPLLGDPGAFPVAFHQGDAYAFRVATAGPAAV